MNSASTEPIESRNISCGDIETKILEKRKESLCRGRVQKNKNRGPQFFQHRNTTVLRGNPMFLGITRGSQENIRSGDTFIGFRENKGFDKTSKDLGKFELGRTVQ